MLGPGRFGTPLHFFETVDSTQSVALDLAKRGCPEGTLVVADEQSEGMGRMGRTWHSARGMGLWLSLVLRPHISPSEGGLLAAWAGLAVLKALDTGGGSWARLKWPNDVLVNSRKLCGILVNAKSVGEVIKYAVVGLGMNVNHDGCDFPSDIASTATSLRMARGQISDRAVLLGEVVREMEHTYHKALSNDGRESIVADAQRASVLMGKEITVKSHTSSLSGIATRLDADGALVVVDPRTGCEGRILTGDVEMVRVREEEQ